MLIAQTAETAARMPEWLSHAITGLCSAGGMAAMAAAYVKVVNARHKNALAAGAAQSQEKRETRADEIAVLHQSIDELRRDRDELKADLAAQRKYFEERTAQRDREYEERSALRDREINDLKSEHTACLVEQAKLQAQNRYLTERNRLTEQRVGKLEAEVEGLRGGASDGAHPVGG